MFKVTCIDNVLNTVNDTFKLTVTNNAPVSSAAIGTVYAVPTEQFLLYFRNYYTDADEASGQWMTFSIAETLPSWLNLDS